MNPIDRREALTRLAYVSLGVTGLAALSTPGGDSRSEWQNQMPELIPPGWSAYRANLIPNRKSGGLFWSRNTQSSVYLGNGAVITAAHNGPPPDAFDVRSVRFSLTGWRNTSDILLYRVRPRVELPTLAVAELSPIPGDPLVHAGMGAHRSELTRFSPGVYRFAYTLEESKSAPGPYLSPLFRFESIPFSPNQSPTWCKVGDSGGPILAWNSIERRWSLVGLITFASFLEKDSSNKDRVIAYAIDLTHPFIRYQINRYIEK